jgi:hypothetical protein
MQHRSMGRAKRRELGAVMMVHKADDKPFEPVSTARVVQLPFKQPAGLPANSLTEPTSDASSETELAQAYERFQVQVRLDVEHERELLYKSLLVVEVLVFLFVLREMLLRWLA